MTEYSRDLSFHLKNDEIIEKIDWLFHIIPFTLLRHTNGVDFHSIPFIENINGMERVVHWKWAKSPWKVWEIEEWWYMHPSQEDNLITLEWVRIVELYTPKHWKIEVFEISPDYIKLNWILVLNWPGILGWPTWVFHRNSSINGSVSMNLWIRFKWFNIDTEFNIYDVDFVNKKIKVIRKWNLDQPK